MSHAEDRLVVVGGGPCGLAAAIHARCAGHDVLVVEPRAAPIDKACGEGIMPAGVDELRRLGVHPAGHPICGISYRGHLGGGPCARAALTGPPGLGVRRTELHARLHERAMAAGVDVLSATAVGVRLLAEGVEVEWEAGARRGRVSGSYLIVADGLRSSTRRRLGLERPGGGRPRRYGLRRHYRLAPRSADVEVHWGPTAEAYLTPVAGDLVAVAILTGRRAGFDDHLAQFPVLCRWLDTGVSEGDDRGAGPLRQRSRSWVAGRALLVGDAAGYVDAVTGEGISLGLAQARMAVDAVTRGRPEEYEAQWRALTRVPFGLTAALTGATRWRVARRGIVPAAARLPGVFDRAVDRLAYGR